MRANHTDGQKGVVEFWMRRVAAQAPPSHDDSAPPVLARPGAFVQAPSHADQERQPTNAVQSSDCRLLRE